VSRTTVYWFDDAPWGGCRVPQSWKILYQDKDGQWIPVENPTPYGTEKGFGNEVQFKPVTTKALKLEVKLQEKNAAGIYEWQVE